MMEDELGVLATDLTFRRCGHPGVTMTNTTLGKEVEASCSHNTENITPTIAKTSTRNALKEDKEKLVNHGSKSLVSCSEDDERFHSRMPLEEADMHVASNDELGMSCRGGSFMETVGNVLADKVSFLQGNCIKLDKGKQAYGHQVANSSYMLSCTTNSSENNGAQHTTLPSESSNIPKYVSNSNPFADPNEVKMRPGLSRGHSILHLPPSSFPSSGLVQEFQQRDLPPQHGCRMDRLSPTPKEEYLNERNLLAIDAHAQTTPIVYLAQPISTLVQFLVKTARDDLEKVRVIFRWLTCQHITSLRSSDDIDPSSVLYRLLRIKTKQLQYSQLFAEMCRYAGVECVVLSGYVKGDKYVLGETLSSSSTGSWNAVLLDGIWRLLDPHWGSRYVIGSDQSADWIALDDVNELGQTASLGNKTPDKLNYRCNDFYFLTDPHQFIFTHFPDDHNWQLLAKKLTFEEFTMMIYVKPEFFQLGVTATTHPCCKVHTKNPELSVLFGVPRAFTCDQFKFRLYSQKSTLSKEYGRFLFMELREDVLECHFRLSLPGSYRFELFCRGLLDESFSMITAYLILYTGDGTSCPLPEGSERPWGPGQDIEALGLRPVTHKGGKIITDNGKIEITFECIADAGDIELSAELQSNQHSPEDLRNCVIYRLENKQAIINVTLPENGEYALQIFGKNTKMDFSAGYPHVCDYLIQCNVPCARPQCYQPVLYPILPNGKLGQVPSRSLGGNYFYVVGDPSDPYIERSTNDEMMVKVSSNRRMHYLCDLRLHTVDAITDVSDYCLYNNTEGGVAIKLRFPATGMYHLAIYGRVLNNNEKTENPFSNVFNYIIKVEGATDKPERFPRPFDMWSAGCVLIEPESGMLRKRDSVKFGVLVPGAKKVALVGSPSSTWKQLSYEDGVWQGTVDTGDNDKFTLTAAYGVRGDNNARQYTSLLMFQAVGDNLIEVSPEKVYNEESDGTNMCIEDELFTGVDYEQRITPKPKPRVPLISKEERERRQREERCKRQNEIRVRLRAAIETEDRIDLEKVLSEFKYEKMKDIDGDYKTGCDLLDFLRARDSLLESMSTKNLERLRLAIRTIELRGYEQRLTEEIEMARNLLISLERIERLRRDVLNMDASTWMEVRRYTSPHSIVHKVIIGALLLLGDHEGRTKDWICCQLYLTTIGVDGLNRRVKLFNVDDLNPEVAARAKVILEDLDVEEVREVSAGVGTFFVWASGMINEYHSRYRMTADAVPANIERQREILKGRRPPTPRPRGVVTAAGVPTPPASPFSLQRSHTTIPNLSRARTPNGVWGKVRNTIAVGEGTTRQGLSRPVGLSMPGSRASLTSGKHRTREFLPRINGWQENTTYTRKQLVVPKYNAYRKLSEPEKTLKRNKTTLF